VAIIALNNPIFALRYETVRRFRDFQDLSQHIDHKTVLDHILAADELLLGLPVTAHQSRGADDASPDRSGTLPAPEKEAWMSLSFANYSMVAVAREILQQYLNVCQQRHIGARAAETQSQLKAWEKIAMDTNAALIELRGARFEGNERLQKVMGYWPEVCVAISQIRTQYRNVLMREGLRYRFNGLAAGIVLGFITLLLLVWALMIARF
jgi:hypothetical protein